ncbi:MAG: hypothetical protein ACC631_03990 [Halocynthiibacter sp.]
MEVGAIEAKAEEVFELMGKRLPVGGKTLGQRTRKAGRLLPRGIRQEARFLAEAADLSRNPKLVKMIDPGRVDRAHLACLRHLQNIDVAERRRTYFLGVLSSIGFAVFTVGAVGLKSSEIQYRKQ